MRRSGWFGVLVTALLVSLSISGCSFRAAPAPPPEPALPMPREVAVVEEAPVVGAPPEAGADLQRASLATSVERLVIRTADLELVVPDTEDALDEIQALAEELGGYVVTLNTYQYQQGVEATITFRVPADSFREALDRVRDLATTVRQKSISGQDVTEEYVDLQARLRHLRAKEEQLLEFLDQAEDTEAVMQVYAELSRTQEEIERVKGRMQYLENQAALATITAHLIPDELAQPLEVGGWNLPGTLRNAVETLLDVLEFAVKALIYLTVVGIPTLLVIAAPIVGLVSLIRWLIRRSRQTRP